MTLFKKDQWLSEQIDKAAYTFTDIKQNLPDKTQFKSELNKLIQLHDDLFIQCKVPTNYIELIGLLERNQFRLVDTNVQFKKNLDRSKKVHNAGNSILSRIASSNDKKEVMKIANNNFKYSRFHLDPFISNEVANQIKSEWVGNYFTGERGDNMVVSETDGCLSGFVQLLEKGDHFIIDLISVDKNYQRRGVAGSMLDYCDYIYQHLDFALVGTQIANIGSVNLYLKHQFKLINSKYVFHFNQTKIK